MKNKCMSTQIPTQRQQVQSDMATSIWNNGQSQQRCLPLHRVLDGQKYQQRTEKSTFQHGQQMHLRSLDAGVSQSCSEVKSRTSWLAFEFLPWMEILLAELSWTRGQKKDKFHKFPLMVKACSSLRPRMGSQEGEPNCVTFKGPKWRVGERA